MKAPEHEAPAGETRDRLLDAAESLCAEAGFDATSRNQITTGAGANLAAVNYHFGSKDALIEAVFRRRVEPLNADRLRRLDALEKHGDSATLEAILEAWLVPAMRLGHDDASGGRQFVRLLGRIYSEPGPRLANLVPQLFGEVFARFRDALARALPSLPPAELIWRMHFLLGSMIHTIADPARIERFSGGLCDASDTHLVTLRLISFVAAGLRAPLPEELDR